MEPMVPYQAPPSPSPLWTIRLLCGHVGEVRLGLSSGWPQAHWSLGRSQEVFPGGDPEPELQVESW